MLRQVIVDDHFNTQIFDFYSVFLTLAMLSGCNQNEQKQTDKVEIKAAPN
jgi:hypothetical protein